MEVNWMLIHTPEAESLCFFRHTERKCCLPSVMTHCPFVDVYLLLFKNRRQKTESRPTTTETSKTIHTRKKEVWEVNCIAQCRGVWQPWALFSSLGPGKKSPHLNTRVLPGLPGQPLSPMSSSPTTASHPPHRDWIFYLTGNGEASEGTASTWLSPSSSGLSLDNWTGDFPPVSQNPSTCPLHPCLPTSTGICSFSHPYFFLYPLLTS